jgi:hypothetical protein
MTTTCAISLASWASPVVQAQTSVPTHQGSGQQGEFDWDHHESGQQGEFDGDHQDAGDAANDGKEGPEGGHEAHEVGEPASCRGSEFLTRYGPSPGLADGFRRRSGRR